MSKKENRRRTIVKKFSVSEEEYKVLQRKIYAAGEPSFQSYAFQMLFNGKVENVDFSELQKLNFEINKLGNNINQLAKAAHVYKQVSPDDIEELTEEFSKLRKEVSERFYEMTQRGE